MKRKDIPIDWDNLNEVSALSQMCSQRMAELGKVSPKVQKKRRVRETIDEYLEAVERILRSNISSLYSESILSEERRFYVYCHYDEDDWATTPIDKIPKLPFYIGKGTNGRMDCMDRGLNYSNRLSTVKNLSKVKIADGLTEKESLILEAKLIDIFGLTTKRGCLVNLSTQHAVEDRWAVYGYPLFAFPNIRRKKWYRPVIKLHNLCVLDPGVDLQIMKIRLSNSEE
jgi:hypothetical protein